MAPVLPPTQKPKVKSRPTHPADQGSSSTNIPPSHGKKAAGVNEASQVLGQARVSSGPMSKVRGAMPKKVATASGSVSPLDGPQTGLRVSVVAIIAALDRLEGQSVVSAAMLLQLKQDCGGTREQMAMLEQKYEAKLVLSASSGQALSLPNDIHGMLKLGGRGKLVGRSTLWPVIKSTVPSREGPAQDLLFVETYGFGVLRFQDVLDAAEKGLIPRRESPQAAPKSGVFSRAKNKQRDIESGGDTLAGIHHDRGAMETALCTFFHERAKASALGVRRSVQESPDDVLMQRPLNPNAIPSGPGWWANRETGLLPSSGPLMGNGMRPIQMDFNKPEGSLIIFENEYERRDDGVPIPPDQRPQALRSAGRTESMPASMLAGGPMHGAIHGITGWEVVGPASLVGVKVAKGERAFGELMQRIAPSKDKENAGDAQPATIHVTTEVGAVVELRTGPRVTMRLLNPQPASGHDASGDLMRPDDSMHPDLDVFLLDGRYQGVHHTASGLREPTLIATNGRRIPIGPFIKDGSGMKGISTDMLHVLMRLISAQPAVGRGDDGVLDRTVNTALRVALKVGTVYGWNMVGRMAAERAGVSNLSVLGGGNIGFGEIAKSVAWMVISQEAFTVASQALGKMVPANMQRPEGVWGKVAVKFAAPAIEEMARLSLNMKIQESIGIHRGNVADVLSLMTAAVVKGGTQWMKSRSGAPENHPLAHTGLALFYGLFYNIARGMANAYNLPEAHGHPSTLEIGASQVARLLGRLDMIYEPVLQTVLDQTGIVGEHASAADDQLSRETRMSNFVSCLDAAINDLSVKIERGVDNMAEHRPALEILQCVAMAMDASRRQLNRAGLEFESTWFQKISGEIAQVESAAAHSTKPLSEAEARAIDERLTLQMQEMTGAIELEPMEPTGESSVASAARQRPAVYDTSLLAPPDRRAYKKTSDAAHEAWHAEPGSTKEVARHHDVNLDHGGVARPADTQARAFADSARLARDSTTYTTHGQAAALPVTKKMSALPGINTPRPVRETGLPRVGGLLKWRLDQSSYQYTENSGDFHMPIRFDYVCRIEPVPIRPSSRITVPHMVMTASGSDETVDPSAILDVNLAARHAPKFPGMFKRAVVTDASYIVPGAKTRDGKTVVAGKAPRKHVTQGEIVATTEMLSMTASSQMAAYFGAGINAGAQKDRSQLLVVKMLTGVNFAAITDLVQGEVVAPPGVLMRITKIDPNPGKSHPEINGSEDLGQVDYAEQVNTHELMDEFRKLAGSKGKGAAFFEEGKEMIEPRSGHLVTQTLDVSEGDWIFDLEADRFRKCDPVADKGQPALVWGTPKSYFLGVGTDDPKKFGKDGPPPRAAWLQPVSNFVAIRAATHALILKDDPLVTEGHMDIAKQNTHHAHFLEVAKYWDSVPGKAELARQAQVRQEAGKVADFIGGKKLESMLTPGEAAFFAAMLTNLLRRPIRLLSFGAGDGMPTDLMLHQTYDGEDFIEQAKEPGELASQMNFPPVVLCMSSDGFYNEQRIQGQRKMLKLGADSGPTLGGLLHAFHRAAYPELADYKANDDDDAVLIAGQSAVKDVKDIVALLKSASKVKDLQLQQHMVTLHGTHVRTDDGDVEQPVEADEGEGSGSRFVEIA